MAWTERQRLSVRIAVQMTLSALPWRLLSGGEKFHKSPEETRRRIGVACDQIIAKLEQMRITFEKAPPSDGGHGHYVDRDDD